jgi:hypothetical protein
MYLCWIQEGLPSELQSSALQQIIISRHLAKNYPTSIIARGIGPNCVIRFFSVPWDNAFTSGV